MVRSGETQHAEMIADHADAVWHWSTPAGQRRVERRAAMIAAAAGLGPGIRALELGCGTGVFTARLAQTGAPIVAVDISPVLLGRAASRSITGDVTFRVEDAERLSFQDGVFDAVVGSSILHHLSLDLAILEMFRVLKPGGCIAFAEPNMMNPHVAFERSAPALRRWAGVSPRETAFFRWSLAARLRAAGFIDVRVDPFDFLHPAVPARLIGVVRGLGRALERVPLVREIAGSLLIRGRRPRQGSATLPPNE